jgi:transcriptional regulator with XRE-family HTH domain
VSRTSAFKKRIGRALKARRTALKLSQEAFAELVNKHRVNYSRIETGKINIRVDTLEKLSAELKVRPWELLKLADEIAGITLTKKS